MRTAISLIAILLVAGCSKSATDTPEATFNTIVKQSSAAQTSLLRDPPERCGPSVGSQMQQCQRELMSCINLCYKFKKDKRQACIEGDNGCRGRHFTCVSNIACE